MAGVHAGADHLEELEPPSTDSFECDWSDDEEVSAADEAFLMERGRPVDLTAALASDLTVCGPRMAVGGTC